jgi:hypothetical protein
MPQYFKIIALPYCTERANSTKYLKTMSYVEIDFTIFRKLRNIVTYYYGISYTLPR